MRSLKRVLQDWLGITALANKMVDQDIHSGRYFDEAGEVVVEEIGKVFLNLGSEEQVHVSRGYKH